MVHARDSGVHRVADIAKRTGETVSFVRRWLRRFDQTGAVDMLPRSGRRAALKPHHVHFLLKQVREGAVFNAQQLANVLQQKFRLHVSKKTVMRALNEHGVQYKYKPPAPLLLPRHYRSRVQFAKANSRRAWKGVLFTDSKYFYTHPLKKGRGVKQWLHPDDKQTEQIPKHASAVHVYMGVSYFGTTKLVFVTGTTGQKSPFINPRTSQPYDGVCALEYQQVVLPALLGGGAETVQWQRALARQVGISARWCTLPQITPSKGDNKRKVSWGFAS